jgi:excisionase family DNA binding protein
MIEQEHLLTPGEVAKLMRVDPKTVTRWAADGKLSSIRTPGGHRRFRESDVRALLAGEQAPKPRPAPARAPAAPAASVAVDRTQNRGW